MLYIKILYMPDEKVFYGDIINKSKGFKSELL